jgi:hypothetical protein
LSLKAVAFERIIEQTLESCPLRVCGSAGTA